MTESEKIENIFPKTDEKFSKTKEGVELLSSTIKDIVYNDDILLTDRLELAMDEAFKAGKNAVKRIVRQNDLDEANIKLEEAGVIEELIEQCRTYRGKKKPCFNENCRMKDGCPSYFGHKVLI